MYGEAVLGRLARRPYYGVLRRKEETQRES
jgi:hypothetical protein